MKSPLARGGRKGGAFLKNEDLWGQVGRECLAHASRLLNAETTPTAATVEVVKALVETACMIDTLNLRWEQQKSISIPAFCKEGDFSGEATP